MRVWRRTTVVAAVVLISTTVAGAPAAGAPEDRGRGADDAASHWTPARREAAIPRDLVIDHRGLAYLRLPDGRLQPHGHDTPGQVAPVRAEPAPASRPAPAAKPAPGGDTEGPAVSDRVPAHGDTIGTSQTFSATVSDPSGVKSVSFVIEYPDGRTQSFSGTASGSTWSVSLNGFSAGNWQWHLVATDGAARGGNKTTTDPWPFTVSTAPPPPPPPGGEDAVANAVWSGGAVQHAAGRLYFEMPANKKWTRWVGYVCSGTSVVDGTDGRSVILTAAHCVYDDAYKTFARNVLFIPDQAASTAKTDLNCGNDPYGCWSPAFGVVDVNWTTRTFPNNVAWDYAYYVVNDSGAHSGTPAASEALDEAVGAMTVQTTAPVLGERTHAIGYSYSEDPKLMFCADALGTEGAVNWWLPACGLSGGSSGGPWLQPAAEGDGPIVSLNSWGYTNQPGMAGPKLHGTSATSCLLTAALGTALTTTGGVTDTC